MITKYKKATHEKYWESPVEVSEAVREVPLLQATKEVMQLLTYGKLGLEGSQCFLRELEGDLK